MVPLTKLPMLRTSFFLVGLLCFSLLQAQDKIVLNGKVSDYDHRPLMNAGVKIAESALGAYTDSSGFFQIKAPTGPCKISFSSIGSEPQELNIVLRRDTFIEVEMKTSMMPEVIITEEKGKKTAQHDEGGVIVLRKESFLLLPAFLGENDPMKAVQMQPGIQSGNEGSRGIFVRGGSPDQNLMLLDGAPVYNPSHIYGFISVFNGDAISRIDVYKDKYPARFGGRLGSVMDIAVEEGDTQKLKGTVSLGLVTSRLYLNGPLTKKKKTTFSLSLRGCFVGLYSVPISRRQLKGFGYDAGEISYYFGDINAKVVHHFNAKNKLELNFFTNRDYYSVRRQYENEGNYLIERNKFDHALDWSNEVASLAWVNKPAEKWELTNRMLFSRYNLNTSQLDNYTYIYKNDPPGSEYYNSYFSEVQSFINNAGWNGGALYSGIRHTVRTGAGVNALIYDTGHGFSKFEEAKREPSDTTISRSLVTAWETFAYAEDEFKPVKKITVGFGIHARTYSIDHKTFFTILPRLNMLYNPVKEFFLRASASGLSQNLHLLTVDNFDVLNDHWVPATRTAPPQKGWNFSGGIIQKLPRHFEWSVDGFYRIMNNLVDFKSGENHSNVLVPWEERVVAGGSGEAHGAEFYFARTGGRITGSVAYTLAWSRRKFDELNRGEYFPYKYDMRHNLAAQINWRIGTHFEIGAAWIYGSGISYTLAVQSYDSWSAVSYYDDNIINYGYGGDYHETINYYESKNNYRLPAYHHLDLSFTYTKRAKRLEHAFNLSMYNVYNHFNIFYIYNDTRTDSQGNRVTGYTQLSLFPILPSVAYTIRF